MSQEKRPPDRLRAILEAAGRLDAALPLAADDVRARARARIAAEHDDRGGARGRFDQALADRAFLLDEAQRSPWGQMMAITAGPAFVCLLGPRSYRRADPEAPVDGFSALRTVCRLVRRSPFLAAEASDGRWYELPWPVQGPPPAGTAVRVPAEGHPPGNPAGLAGDLYLWFPEALSIEEEKE